jgi:hypothetical protein
VLEQRLESGDITTNHLDPKGGERVDRIVGEGVAADSERHLHQAPHENLPMYPSPR